MGEAMTVTARDANGRFMAGQSGNPAGKKPGTHNRATLLCDALADGEATRVARILIDKALAGDAVVARFLIDRLMPRPRDRAIELDLPEGNTAVDALAASNATVAAMAAGEITPDEALRVTRVLDGRLRALKAAGKESARKEPSPHADPSTNAQESRGEGAFPAKNLHRQDSPHPPIALATGLSLPRKAGQSPLTEAPILPRPFGEREGPAPQAWEDEGEAQLPSRFRQQKRRRKLPLAFPPLAPLRQVRRGPSSPRGERSKGASSPYAIALSRSVDRSSGGRKGLPTDLLHCTCISTTSGALPSARVAAFS